MKFSEIKERTENLPRLIEKSAFIDLLLSEITIMNRSIWSDDSIDMTEKINGLKWSNELVHRIQNIQFELKRQVDNKALERVFNNIIDYGKESITLKAHLAPCLISSYERFQRLDISWDYELNIDPKDRFLQIWDEIPFKFDNPTSILSIEKYDKINDEQFNALQQEYETLKTDWNLGNLLSVGIAYSYSDIQLPKTYDIVFDKQNPERFWEVKVVIKYAFNFRTFFHTDLWRGHHSHCLIEIIGERPEIFDELPKNDGGRTTHKGICLCNKYDWEYI